MKISVDSAIALGLFFLMLGALVVPFWTTAYTGAAGSALGVTQATFGAILLALFVYYIFKGK